MRTVNDKTAAGLCVIVFGAHKDDETIGSGATMAGLRARGAEVHVRTATDSQRGEPQAETMENRGRIRTAELVAACEVLGVASSDTFGFADGDLCDSPELRDAIVGAVEDVSANLVIVSSPDDYHTDHRALGLSVLNCQHRYTGDPPAVVLADQFIRGIGIGTAMPDLWLDATPYWDAQEAAYACFTSQGGHLAEYMRALAVLRGQQRKPRVQYAQCFRGPRTAGHDQGLKMLVHALNDH
jgi:LmbE family N-acetylglucosaminyl deacetylase